MKTKLVMIITHGLGDMYPPLSIVENIAKERNISKDNIKIYVDTAYFGLYNNYPDNLRESVKKLIETVTLNWEPIPIHMFSSGDWHGIPDRRNGPVYENIKNDFFFYRLNPLKEFAKQFINDDTILIAGTGVWSYEWVNGENVPLSFSNRKKLEFNITQEHKNIVDKMLEKKCVLIHCRKKGAAINDIYFNTIVDKCIENNLTPILIGLRNEVRIQNNNIIDIRETVPTEFIMYLIERCHYMITSGSMFTFHRFFSNLPTIIGLFESNVDRWHCFHKSDIENPNYIIYDADQPHIDKIINHIQIWGK